MRVYRNTAYFIDEVYNLVGDEYTVLSQFEKMKKHVLMKHNVCGTEWLVTPDAFLRKNGSRCPICYGNIRKTTEEFRDEIFELYGLEYSVLGEYKSAKTKIKVIHNVCGYIYDVRADNILQGNECPKCYGTPLKTYEQFESEVNEFLGPEYKVVSQYIRNNVKVQIQHIECGSIYSVIPRNIISKQTKCGVCKNKELGNLFRKSHEQFVSDLYLRYGEEYTVLGEYKGSHTDILVRHEKCKREYDVKPTDILSGKQCSRCRHVERINTEIFKRLVYELVGDEYIVVGEYINARTPITLFHNKCKEKYDAHPYEFLHKDVRCPCKSRSKGNERIINSLKKNPFITYKPEYTDSRCRDKRDLPFDAAVFYNGELLCFFEFDGIQHKEPVKRFGGMEKFKIQQYHDRIKDDFSQSINIPLIRINDEKFDEIESIVDNKLDKLLYEREQNKYSIRL